MSPDDLARALVQPGRASIPYLDSYNPDRPLMLECFRTQAHNPDRPVVIVQDGASRPVVCQSYQHMANEPALPDAVVAPGARATVRWGLEKSLLEHPHRRLQPKRP